MATDRAQAWDNLSPAYRQRLIRANYTRDDYIAGISRRKARGHARTPERPERASLHPERYPEYIARNTAVFVDTPQRRQELIDRIDAELRAAISLPKGNPNRINSYDEQTLEYGVMNASPRLLAIMWNTSAEEWRSYARYGSSYAPAIPDEWEWLDAQVKNPFYYH